MTELLSADVRLVPHPNTPAATRQNVESWAMSSMLNFGVDAVLRYHEETGRRIEVEMLDALDLTPEQRVELSVNIASRAEREAPAREAELKLMFAGTKEEFFAQGERNRREREELARRPRHNITPLGDTPKAGASQRAHGKDLRWSAKMPKGLIEVTTELIVVPEDGYGSVFSAFAPKGWAGTLPTRATPTPFRLRLCIDAPRKLFMLPGRERHDYEFRNVWLPLHDALEADLELARRIPHEPGGAPVLLPDLTFAQLRRRTRAIITELGPWIAAASALLEESRAAIDSLMSNRVEIAQDGDVVREPGLPAPWVAYPSARGLCLAYADRETGPFRLCECSREAVEAYADAADADAEQNPDWVNRMPPQTAAPSAVRCGRDLRDLLDRRDAWTFRICHRCVGTTPTLSWASGVGAFDQFHGWWVAQALAVAGLFRLEPVDDVDDAQRAQDLARAVENIVRQSFGHRNVGEGWVRETQLAKVLSQALPGATLVRHFRPAWLDRLELDVWIPSLQLGVEHQGQQHYTPVDAWGGAEALARTQERDARKVRLAAANGVTLIHVRYDEPLTLAHIAQRLENAGIPAADNAPSPGAHRQADTGRSV